ncbi:hypothetical protein X975_23205, partial [Stegodyphus mimosarum]
MEQLIALQYLFLVVVECLQLKCFEVEKGLLLQMYRLSSMQTCMFEILLLAGQKVHTA